MSPKTLKTFGVAVLSIIGGTLFLFLLGGMKPEYIGSYALLGVSGTVLAYPLSRVLTGQTPWFSLHAVVMAILFMYYVAAPASVIYFDFESNYFGRAISPEEMFGPVLATLVGICCYLLGHQIGPKRPRLTRGLEWYFTDTELSWPQLGTNAVLIFVLGVVAWVYMFAIGGGAEAALANMGGHRRDLITGAGGFVFHVAKFAYVGVLLAVCRWRLNIFTLAMLIPFTLLLLLWGARSFVAILLIGTLIVYRFRYLKKVPLSVWAGFAIGVFFLMTYLVVLRAAGGSLERANRIYARRTEGLEGKVEAFMADFSFMIQMAEVYDSMGSKIPYQYGRTFGTVSYIIPGFIWQGQYDVFKSGSLVYLENLFPERVGKIGITPSIMSEFYMNFGWYGIVGCSGLMGVLVRWWDGVMIRPSPRKYQSAFIVIHALFSMNMMRVMKNGSHELIFPVYFLVPLFFAYYPNSRFLFNPPAMLPEAPEEPVVESDAGYDDEEVERLTA